MILPQLLWRFLRHRDDAEFYRLQAVDAIRWLRARGISFGPSIAALDLGCGHGMFGHELAALGCRVTFADEDNFLMPELQSSSFHRINLDHDEFSVLGQYDLVICSNVFEHLARPEKFLQAASELLMPQGRLYLSWTNWLSPWGGHEFSPWHYFGPSLGPAIYDRISRRPRFHRPQVNLFPTYIGWVLRFIREHSALEIEAAAPRYYTEFPFLLTIPGLREFVAWNCALLLKRRTP
ncbi:MAG TPA: class I SAM-dependent methyltransferase [Verrucomicrobiota bacterium]|nr:class I SAM-dependent methyltransferase [Verrucomicrobiota bacterium]